MFSIKRLAIATLIALLPTFSVAAAVVSHFEPLQRTQFNQTDKVTQSFGPTTDSEATTSLQFEALGRNFDLRLQTNERVAAGMDAKARAAQIRIYRGQLAGIPTSWVRIVIFEDMPRGVLWDGEAMYAIEAPGDSAVATDEPVIFRLSDVHIPAGAISCGSGALAGNAAAVAKTLITSSKAAIARGPGAVSEITMSVISDFEFTDAKGGDAGAVAALMTRMNNIDGYFSEQVGVQITVPNPIETYSNSDDPFTDTNVSDDLLDEISEYRLQNAIHSNQGLTHLWTGKDLAGTTVGVAWQGTLCETYFGSGLTEGNDSAFIDSLIATHEIGHNFGAEHDGEEDSTCEDTVGSFIMSPSVNGSEEFSQCSIDIMQAQAAAARCVTALPTVDVGIEPEDQSGRVYLGVATTLEYEISSNGLLNASGVLADFTLPAFLDLGTVTTTLGTCTSGAGTVDCDLGELAGQSFQRVTLSVTPNGYGTGTLTANASTTDPDPRPSNDQYQLQLVVEDPVDLVANTPTAATVSENQTTTITATLANVSDTAATDVALRVSLQNGMRAESATWSAGDCTVTSRQVDCTTDVFAAQSSSDLSVTITALFDGRRDVTLEISAAEADLVPANNTVVGEVVIRNADGGGGGDGGGGATHLLMLLLALLTVRRMNRRRR